MAYLFWLHDSHYNPISTFSTCLFYLSLTPNFTGYDAKRNKNCSRRRRNFEVLLKLNKSDKDADGGSRGVMVLVLELAVEAAQVTPAPVVAGGEPPPPS